MPYRHGIGLPSLKISSLSVAESPGWWETRGLLPSRKQTFVSGFWDSLALHPKWSELTWIAAAGVVPACVCFVFRGVKF